MLPAMLSIINKNEKAFYNIVNRVQTKSGNRGKGLFFYKYQGKLGKILKRVRNQGKLGEV